MALVQGVIQGIWVAEFAGETIEIALPVLEIAVPAIQGKGELVVLRGMRGVDHRAPHLAFLAPKAVLERQMFKQILRARAIDGIEAKRGGLVELKPIVEFVE